jgi:hypothetical protein
MREAGSNTHRPGTCKGQVEKKEVEVSVIVEANTVAYPRAVVVHLEDTLTADRTVVHQTWHGLCTVMAPSLRWWHCVVQLLHKTHAGFGGAGTAQIHGTSESVSADAAMLVPDSKPCMGHRQSSSLLCSMQLQKAVRKDGQKRQGKRAGVLEQTYLLLPTGPLYCAVPVQQQKTPERLELFGNTKQKGISLSWSHPQLV